MRLSLVLVLSGCALGQNKTDITDTGELSIRFQHTAEPGSTRIYAVERTKIPNAPKIPNSYQPLGDKGYLVSTDVIDLGNPTAFFKAPVNTPEAFARVSILRLAASDIAPDGYEWQDCTTSLEVVRGQRDPKMLEERKDFDEWYTARMEKLLPDFGSRTITCRPDDKWKNEEYFVLASRIARPSSQPFTNLNFAVVTENRPEAKEAVYRVSIKNTGPKDIANLSIFSRFDVDMTVKKVVPGQGICVPPARNLSGGEMICQLGRLAAGSELTIEFVGSETGMSRTVEKGTLNVGWYIDVYFVENLGDPFWGANRSHYRPLAGLSN